jgi:hypothetical protein
VEVPVSNTEIDNQILHDLINKNKMAVVGNIDKADVVAISDETADDKDKAVGVKYTRKL